MKKKYAIKHRYTQVYKKLSQFYIDVFHCTPKLPERDLYGEWLDKLTGIYVDDKLVDAANYTLQSGSTILTFNASYLTICIIVMAIPNAC